MKDSDDQNEKLKIQKDILWGMYQEHRTHETTELVIIIDPQNYSGDK